MERYICENIFVPLRSAPTHKSEMLSQVLFGEKYTIVDRSGSWLKIKTLFDNYQGWIDSGHLQHSVDEDNSMGHVINRSLLCHKHDSTKAVLEAGCEIFNPDFDSKTFYVGKNIYSAAEDFSLQYVDTKESLPEIAMKFINSPYIWGGRIPCGVDCSGFTQLAFKIFGIAIPRDSSAQSDEGVSVDFIEEAIPGDLAFFDDERGRITHVGMIISSGLIIHASGRVRIDQIDHQGIFKNEIRNYSHNLRTIRRITG